MTKRKGHKRKISKLYYVRNPHAIDEQFKKSWANSYDRRNEEVV